MGKNLTFDLKEGTSKAFMRYVSFSSYYLCHYQLSKQNDRLYLKQRVHRLLTDFNVCPCPPND